MRLEAGPLFISLLVACITALQNGIDHGITMCRQESRGTGVTIKVEKGDFGKIASEGYPTNFSTTVYHGHLCNVELQACSTCKIRLKFLAVRFPACEVPLPLAGTQSIGPRSVCLIGCDHLRMFEADQPYHSATERNYFSDAESSLYETISSRVVIQHCMSNSTAEDGKRFLIEYEVIDKIQIISGTVTAPLYSVSNGVITSPNFPHGYALNGETFTYMIQNLDPYGHVQLVFDDWDLAEESHIQVYDDLSGKNIATIFGKRKRPTILSNANTLVLVFNAGKDKCVYCNHIGFKATYTFVSDDTWTQRPRTDCSDTYRLETGGVIEFRTDPSALPQWYDCVWTLKRVMTSFPDAVMLRIEAVKLGKGWQESGVNSLEIYEGVTSLGTMIKKYTTDNFTAGDMLYSSGEGLYIRLKGVFNMADILKIVFTGVNNYTNNGCPVLAGFLCDNHWCIHDDLTCDGVNHCGDNSDENPVFTCPRFEHIISSKKFQTRDKHKYVTQQMPLLTTTEISCFGRFRCHDDSGCIDTRLTCDKIAHCKDQSDERGCALYIFKSKAWRPGHQTFPFNVSLYVYVLLSVLLNVLIAYW
ncbi:hypothetical protein DPMN_169862 [Dreissena polymorpha]|uniref:CUB domain-containing protein n=1 Tax=Dreissena polymorpha TaxID=45954 RepID=A0A9D4DV51_DREPO|nr:hypothetical protein DPMN_169862 [Dreissena polymorpha]